MQSACMGAIRYHAWLRKRVRLKAQGRPELGAS